MKKFIKFGELVRLSKGKKHEPTSQKTGQSKRFIQIDDLRNNNNIKFTNDLVGVDAKSNDLLIAWDGANAGTVGWGLEGFIGSTIARMRLKEPSDWDTSYLGFFLRSQFGTLRANATGATIPHLSRQTLDSLNVPKFELATQRQIAQVLSRAEELIAARQRSLALLDTLLKSTFHDLFGDPVKNEKGWEMKRLRDFGRVQTGNTPPRDIESFYYPPHIDWVKTDNIEEDHLFVTQSKEFLSKDGLRKGRVAEKGTLLVACIAGSINSIGRACITDRSVAFNQQINSLSPNPNVSPEFLYWLFKIGRPIIQSVSEKGMKKIITKSVFESIVFYKPPIALQNQFADIVTRVEALKAKQRESLDRLQTLYQSLMQRAFAGELDLSRVRLPGVEAVPESPEIASPDVPVRETPSFWDVPGTYWQQPPMLAEGASLGVIPAPPTRVAGLAGVAALGIHPFISNLISTLANSKVIRQVGESDTNVPTLVVTPVDPFDAVWNVLAKAKPTSFEQLRAALPQVAYADLKKIVFDALTQGKLFQEFDDETKELTESRLAGRIKFTLFPSSTT